MDIGLDQFDNAINSNQIKWENIDWFKSLIWFRFKTNKSYNVSSDIGFGCTQLEEPNPNQLLSFDTYIYILLSFSPHSRIFIMFHISHTSSLYLSHSLVCDKSSPSMVLSWHYLCFSNFCGKLKFQKISFMLWRVFNDRLPTKVNLHKRHIQLQEGDLNCVLCNESEEDLSHMLFSCIIAQHMC